MLLLLCCARDSRAEEICWSPAEHLQQHWRAQRQAPLYHGQKRSEQKRGKNGLSCRLSFLHFQKLPLQFSFSPSRIQSARARAKERWRESWLNVCKMFSLDFSAGILIIRRLLRDILKILWNYVSVDYKITMNVFIYYYYISHNVWIIDNFTNLCFCTFEKLTTKKQLTWCRR